MNQRDKELQIETIDKDIKREKDENTLNNFERLEIYNKFYEMEINKLNEEYKDLNPTIH